MRTGSFENPRSAIRAGTTRKTKTDATGSTRGTRRSPPPPERRGLLAPLHLDRAVSHERRHGTDRRPHREQGGTQHARRQREAQKDLVVLLPDRDLPHVPLADDLLDLGQQLVALHAVALARTAAG